MRAHQIIVRCQSDRDHAKVLRIDGALQESYIETLAGLLDGSSHYFLNPPGDRSPIGKCATCGGTLRSEISQVLDTRKPEVDYSSKDRIMKQQTFD